MGGLNNILFARQSFSANVLFEHYRPDLIYMPYEGFAGMIRDLENNPVFQRQYAYIPGSATGRTSMGNTCLGVALRRDSKYYSEMSAILSSSLSDPERDTPVPDDR